MLLRQCTESSQATDKHPLDIVYFVTVKRMHVLGRLQQIAYINNVSASDRRNVFIGKVCTTLLVAHSLRTK